MKEIILINLFFLISSILCSNLCSYTSTCNSNNIEGVCLSISSNCCNGEIISNLCSGSNDIKCCISNKCYTSYGNGTCLLKSQCKGISYSGYCIGPSDLQCCVSNDDNNDNNDDNQIKFGENPYYYNNWCDTSSTSLQYLDDKYCQKKFPSSYDREWKCPINYNDNEENLNGYSTDLPLDKVDVDITTLTNIVSPDDANICLIVTRRQSNGKLYHRYYCNGEDSRNTPYETWSSSKIFAMANAAGKSHSECSTSGLQSSVTGKHGKTALGDLSTIIASYDHTMGYSSNSLSSYFHDLGWRTRINDLVTGSWLNQPTNSLGGNYGEASPSDLGLTLTSTDGSTCKLEKESPPVFPNSLSMLSASELTRRIALYRDLDSTYTFPDSTWDDMKEILYGANEHSTLFPGVQWGGMTSCTSIFVQSAINISQVEVDSLGKWRIFTKLGAGYSSSRGRGEIMNNAYACLPKLDEFGNPIPNSGFEFTLSVRGSVVGDTSLKKAEEKVHTAVVNTIQALLNGKL